MPADEPPHRSVGGERAPLPRMRVLGGYGWHDACVNCCLKLALPIGLLPLSRVLSLNPFPQ